MRGHVSKRGGLLQRCFIWVRRTLHEGDDILYVRRVRGHLFLFVRILGLQSEYKVIAAMLESQIQPTWPS